MNPTDIAIDRMNYFNDPRVTEPRRKPILYTDDPETGEPLEKELPLEWRVCGVCRGEGKHVNPSIDAGGISATEFYEDPEFVDDYMSGAFDVTCNACGGRTTVPGVDWSQLSDADAEAYRKQLDEEAADLACQRAELALGA